MTLTARLSAFFLGALAVVLVGFSASLYLLARAYLHREVADRLEAALDTLTAAAASVVNAASTRSSACPYR